ncbi:hypothetical protein M413DRAFT_426129 [Hebeloma cylindrosporum]|uniref:Uncharacterized protein n=1 Tax=Hebeloma cylindrosporum TaxID=76867 RepID=A0A0C3CBF8_HEBCY|nr:hypothetical protein M413DRAFT_426129 [Hebeloma cylindrosporum h7]
MESKDDHLKIPLPNFLKFLTSNNVPVPKAMAIAGKVYKEYHTRATLATLSDLKLKTLGVESQEDRKLVMASLRKAGYGYQSERRKKVDASRSAESSGSVSGSRSSTSSTKPTAVEILTTPTKRKRKRQVEETNEFLPNGPADEVVEVSKLEFNEVLDEEMLATKSAVINRAPVMMAWSLLVAERMHFSREEALSIASAYTEMNAVTKGVSLGIYHKDTERGSEAVANGSQPYVELIGRRPLYRTQEGQWRALSNGRPVPPAVAFSYICRAFRQTTPHIIGALKLLADSYTAQELNSKAWSLYAEFRPEVNEWGKRSQVSCKTILDLRKKESIALHQSNTSIEEQKPTISNESEGVAFEPAQKKTKLPTLEEYEAALDQDNTFDNVDLDFLDIQ